MCSIVGTGVVRFLSTTARSDVDSETIRIRVHPSRAWTTTEERDNLKIGLSPFSSVSAGAGNPASTKGRRDHFDRRSAEH